LNLRFNKINEVSFFKNMKIDLLDLSFNPIKKTNISDINNLPIERIKVEGVLDGLVWIYNE